MKISANTILWTAGVIILYTIVLNAASDGARSVIVPIVMFAVFVRAAIKMPPVAIAILLYYSMVQGGWFILAAAPVTMLLARRYQRQRLKLELNPVHIRRTVLLAMAALVATLPFIAYSIGAWSSQSRFSPSQSARPLISPNRPGEEGFLTRIARYLGFGDGDGPERGQLGPLQPTPVRPRQPDDPFNWWIVVAIVAILLLLGLAWWLWSRRKRPSAPGFVATTAQPLARLEALGELVGRRRAPHEGAITYGQILAKRTGDARLATAGPLVSSQVYQSAFVNPSEVDNNLRGIEAEPPPPPPQPSLGERMATRADKLPFTKRSVVLGILGLLALVLAGWLLFPRLGDLDRSDRFELGQQIEVVPVTTEHVSDNAV